MMVVNAWSRYFVELLSRFVRQLTISFHTLLCMTSHVIRPWRNTKILRVWKLFCSHRGNSGFKHGSVIVNNVFVYFTLSLSTSLGSPKSTSWFSTFHIGLMFCFFPANLMSSTHTDKNNPFSRCTKKHSQLETFSQPYFNRFFSNCLSHNSPARRWLDHELGHLCRGRRIQMSGHSDSGFSIILEHLPFLPGYKQILHPMFDLRTLAVWIWYPWLLLQSFVILMILVL